MFGEIKNIIDLFGGLLSPITAACVAYIAYRQWKTDDRVDTKEFIEKKISIPIQPEGTGIVIV